MDTNLILLLNQLTEDELIEVSNFVQNRQIENKHSKKTLLIKFNEVGINGFYQYVSYHDIGVFSIIDFIRDKAREERWSGVKGIQQFCKKEFKGTLNHTLKNGWTSLKFNKEEDVDENTEENLYSVKDFSI